MKKQTPIYLDYAAATPIDPRVMAAMQPYAAANFYNPSATYGAAIKVREKIDQTRSLVANWLGARSSEIIFTAGGSEANNLAIHGVMRQFPDASIVVSAIEHESVLAAAHNYACREVAVTPDGRLDLADLVTKIDDNTVMVSVMYANNEIGTVQPLKEISRIINERRTTRRSGLPLYFHSDACQAANYLDLHVSRLGLDMMTLNGGKIYGPKQTGALYIKAGSRLEPIVDGGGQERGLRSGTENVSGIIGFGVALDSVQTDRRAETDRLHDLQTLFLDLITETVPEATVNGSLKYRLPNNIHLTITGIDNERLLIALDESGIQAAAGSACSASDEEASHVLAALGLNEVTARSSLRLTLGRQTTEQDVRQAALELARLVNKR